MKTIVSSMIGWDDLRVTAAWKELLRMVKHPATILRELGTPAQRDRVLAELRVVASTLNPDLHDLRLGSQRTARGLAIWRNVALGCAVYMTVVALSPVGGAIWFYTVAVFLMLALQAHNKSVHWDSFLLARYRDRWVGIAAVRLLAADTADVSETAVKVRAWKPLSPENTFTLPLEDFMERMTAGRQ